MAATCRSYLLAYDRGSPVPKRAVVDVTESRGGRKRNFCMPAPVAHPHRPRRVHDFLPVTSRFFSHSCIARGRYGGLGRREGIEIPLRGLDLVEYALNNVFRRPGWPLFYVCTAGLLHYFAEDILREWGELRVWVAEELCTGAPLGEQVSTIAKRGVGFLTAAGQEYLPACVAEPVQGAWKSVAEAAGAKGAADRDPYEEKLREFHRKRREQTK